MKLKFKELNRFSNVLKDKIRKEPKLMETKFGYACKRFEELNLTDIYQKYNAELADARIDHALADKTTGALLKDPTSPRGYQYNKEGMKAVIKAENDISKAWENTEFEVEPYICKPENLPVMTEEEEEVFTGLVA